jgi:hypothetical protein
VFTVEITTGRTAANTHTMSNPTAAPVFRWKISIDTRKQPPYTPGRQKQYLINNYQLNDATRMLQAVGCRKDHEDIKNDFVPLWLICFSNDFIDRSGYKA